MVTRNFNSVKSAKSLNLGADTTATTTHRTRRKLTVENSHALHHNPYHSADNILMAMQWAHEHYAACPDCRRKLKRRNRAEALRRQVERKMQRITEGGEW